MGFEYEVWSLIFNIILWTFTAIFTFVIPRAAYKWALINTPLGLFAIIWALYAYGNFPIMPVAIFLFVLMLYFTHLKFGFTWKMGGFLILVWLVTCIIVFLPAIVALLTENASAIIFTLGVIGLCAVLIPFIVWVSLWVSHFIRDR